jgi:hypothetical protein
MARSQSWIAAAGLAGALAGAIGALALTRATPPDRDVGVGSHPPPGTPGGELAPELAALRDELRAESDRLRALAADVARLRADVDALGSEPGAAALEPEAGPAGSAAAPDVSAAAPDAPDARPWFDAPSLVELGTAAGDVARLREAYEQNQMEVLYLRDRATRGGWMGTPRYHGELRKLETALHVELGDTDYDLLRFATGRPNRVVVAGVFADSPAERAGLQDGDTILRYGEDAIFTPQDLRRATSEGRAGTTVAVDVLRGEDPHRLYLPRGPLGAQLQAERRPPEARW